MSAKTLSLTSLLIILFQLAVPVDVGNATPQKVNEVNLESSSAFESNRVHAEDDDDDLRNGSTPKYEGHFEHPEDIALSPKILIPKAGIDQSQLRGFYDVLQARNQGGLPDQSFTGLNQARERKPFTAYIRSIPIDLNTVQIPERNPAEEFFHQVRVLTFSLGSTAVALSAFVFLRGRRKDSRAI